MADQRCKAVACGKAESDRIHHGTREEFGGHPFEPEDAAPAPKHKEGCSVFWISNSGYPFQCNCGAEPGPQAEKGGVEAGSRVAGWSVQVGYEGEGPPLTPAEIMGAPVAQPGAGGEGQHENERARTSWQMGRLSPEVAAQIKEKIDAGQAGEYEAAILWQELERLCEPAAGQVGAEQWLSSPEGEQIYYQALQSTLHLSRPNAWLPRIMEAYAAHVTNIGTKVDWEFPPKDNNLSTNDQREGCHAHPNANHYDRYGLMRCTQCESDLREAAEAREKEQMRLKDEYKQFFRAAEARNLELMGELERAQGEGKLHENLALREVGDWIDRALSWPKELSKVTALGEECTPEEVGDFIANLTNVAMERLQYGNEQKVRAESAEYRLAEAEKALREARNL